MRLQHAPVSNLVRSKLSYILIVTCCLVAVADFATTWLALSYNPMAEERGIIASRVVELGGIPGILVADILLIGLLTCLAYVLYRRYRSNLAVILLLGPYICAGMFSAVNNWSAAV